MGKKKGPKDKKEWNPYKDRGNIEKEVDEDGKTIIRTVRKKGKKKGTISEFTEDDLRKLF